MRFRILSDLHFEFHADGGRAFVDSLDVEPDEVLLCAGDLAVGVRLPGAWEMLCERFSRVVVTFGNHEFYGSTRERVVALSNVADTALDNLYILDKRVFEV